MTANEFEAKIDAFFDLTGIILSDILQFLVIFIMYISPLIIILPIYSMLDISGLYYDLSAIMILLISFCMTIWHWIRLDYNE